MNEGGKDMEGTLREKHCMEKGEILINIKRGVLDLL